MNVSDLTAQNPWWKFGKDFWEYDKNLKEVKSSFVEFYRKELKLKKGNIYIIRGTRQTGKTTYIKQTILELLKKNINPNVILYISCDRLASRRELRNIIEDFTQRNKDSELLYIFLDEVTYLVDWNLELKNLADANIINKLIIIATGSNPVKIKEKMEKLPGRRVEGNEYLFKPLNFREFVLQIVPKIISKTRSKEFSTALRLLINKLEKNSIVLTKDIQVKNLNVIMPFEGELNYLFDIYLLTGGFPAAVNNFLKNKFIEKTENIDNTYYEILIRMILGDISKIKRSEIIAREIMKGVIEKYTTKYSYTILGKDLNLVHQNVIEYLEILENSFILEVINSFDISKKIAKIKGEKKIYFSDPFIFHSLSAYTSGADGFQISKENMLKIKDKLIEGVIANHLIRVKEIPYIKEWKTYLWFYYTTTGKEIDFLFKKNHKFIGIESKYKQKVDKRDITQIKEVKKYLILTKKHYEIQDKSIFIPVSIFLSLLKSSERLL